MKRLTVTCLLILSSTLCWAQRERDEEEEAEEKRTFKENLFVGGSVTASFFSGTTILGASPMIGYRIADWVDGGIVLNYNYTGIRDYIEWDDKVKQTTFGGGLFTRLYPVRFIFAQAQLEHNFTTLKYKPSTNNYLPYKENFESNSFLIGAGYTQGREKGSNTFYYVSVLWDIMKDENSPYVDVMYNPSTGARSVRAVPIIRAGINIGLFEGRRNGRR